MRNVVRNALALPVLCIVLLCATSTALAETPAQIHRYDIPAGPLGRNLSTVATRNGIALSFDPGLTQGLQSPALQGDYSALQALNALLSNSGLRLIQRGDGSYTVGRTRHSGPLRLTPIKVRGELQERSLQDTHTSVAVLTGDSLDRAAASNVFDIVDRTPNVFAGEGSNSFVIRGISSSGVGGRGDGGSGLLVDINIDGASAVSAQGQRMGALSTWDLEQIEILRGPQSTQQGRNALAASINLRSNDPGFERQLKARVDYGDFDETRLAVAANLPIVEDTLALRVALEDYSTDGYVDNPTRGEDDYGFTDMKTGRFKVRYRPRQSLDMVLAHTIADRERGANIIDLANWPAERENLSDAPGMFNGENTITNLRINADITSRWALLSETVRYDFDYQRSNDADGTADPLGISVIDIKEQTHSQDLRATYNGSDMRAVIGIFYNEIERDQFNEISFGPFVSISSALRDIENIALYGEVEYDYNEQWTLIAGLRYDDEQRTDILDSAFNGAAAPSQKIDADYDAWLPKAGIVYHWNDRVDTGFTIQRGYRAGVAGIDVATGQSYRYDPEYSTNYELSLRGELTADVTLNGNLFFTDWKDQQVRTEILDNSGMAVGALTENAGRSEVYGGELSLTVAPANWSVYAALGYTHTEFKDYVTNQNDFSGNAFAYAPNWTVSVGGDYYFADGFFIGLDGNFTDNAFADPDNTPGQGSESFFIVDAELGYNFDKVTVQLYARNLFDREYLTRKRDIGGSNGGEPRVVGVSLNAEF